MGRRVMSIERQRVQQDTYIINHLPVRLSSRQRMPCSLKHLGQLSVALESASHLLKNHMPFLLLIGHRQSQQALPNHSQLPPTAASVLIPRTLLNLTMYTPLQVTLNRLIMSYLVREMATDQCNL